MVDRQDVSNLVRGAYAARNAGDVEGVVSCFTQDATFALAGAPEASPVPLRCDCAETLRSAMRDLIGAFELIDQDIHTVLVDGDRAAVQWRAKVRSTRTGETADTEVVDMLQLRDGKIASFTQFIDTALAAKLAGA